MRLVKYAVKTPTGEEFTTTSYKIATSGGNTIINTILEPVEPDKTPAQLEDETEQRTKIFNAWVKMRAQKNLAN